MNSHLRYFKDSHLNKLVVLYDDIFILKNYCEDEVKKYILIDNQHPNISFNAGLTNLIFSSVTIFSSELGRM